MNLKFGIEVLQAQERFATMLYCILAPEGGPPEIKIFVQNHKRNPNVNAIPLILKRSSIIAGEIPILPL